MKERIPGQERGIEGSGGNLPPPTGRGSERLTYPWKSATCAFVLMGTGIVVAYFGMEWTSSPQTPQIATMLTKAIAVPFGGMLGLGIGILIGEYSPFFKQERDSRSIG